MEIYNMSAIEIGELIRDKKISSPEVIQEMFKNIKNENNAYTLLTKEYAFEKAKQVQNLIDNKKLKSILAGVPISIKDNICTKDIKTTGSSKMLENYVPNYNATVFERLENEGIIMIGKLNMDEFAMGDTGETSYFGGCKNPWGKNRTTGGSSSGCASALAYNEAIFTLGSDTGGSIRQPSSFCNITGFKPTYGTVSRYGLICFAPEFDQIGPMTKNVLDCAKTLEIISGYDINDNTTIKMKSFDFSNIDYNLDGLKIGIAKNFIDYSDKEVRDIIFEAIKIFKKLGVTIEEFDLDILDIAMPTYQVLSGVLASSNMAKYDGVSFGYCDENIGNIQELYIKNRTECFCKEVKKRIMLGEFALKDRIYYENALNSKNFIITQFKKAFLKYDLILTPTTPKTALEKGDNTETDTFLVGSNLVGLPSISIPCGFTADNMPVGLHLIANKLNDELLIKAGVCFQDETDYHLKKYND